MAVRIGSARDEPQIEEWRPIDGYEGLYEVSSKGRVRRFRKSRPQAPYRILHPNIRSHQGKFPSNYQCVTLSKNNVRTSYNIHRLVASAFIPNLRNCSVVNHKDGNKHNNSVENLEWCTYEENNAHATKTGLKTQVVLPPVLRGEDNPTSKLKEYQVRKIRELLGTQKYKLREIGDMFGVSMHAIFDIKRGKTWRGV